MATLLFVGLLTYAGYQAALGLAMLWWAILATLVFPFALCAEVRFYRRRRRLQPDQNWHNLPLLNAVGFNRNGAWILPGTPEAAQLARWKRGEGRRP